MATCWLQVATRWLRLATAWLPVKPRKDLAALSARRSHAATGLLDAAWKLLVKLDDPRLPPYLAFWPQSAPFSPATGPDYSGPALPVLRWLPAAAAAAPALTHHFCDQLNAAAESLAWQQSYAAREVQPAFLERYGWCEFIGPRARWQSSDLACGCLLLGPETLYPPHRHEAEEIYVPLSGAAAWQQSNLGWQSREPGSLIHHASFESHAMRTGAAPLLALYLWRGGNLAAPARLDG